MSHAAHLLRYRGKAQVDFSDRMDYVAHMDMKTEGWRDRLLQAVEADGRSAYIISKAAGLGQNYISQLKLDRKEPGVNQLIRLADELDVSVAWLLLGVDVTPRDEQFYRLYQETPAPARKAVVDLLKVLRAVGS
jgi:transcriptional regulator with XRE-family HTH domain